MKGHGCYTGSLNRGYCPHDLHVSLGRHYVLISWTHQGDCSSCRENGITYMVSICHYQHHIRTPDSKKNLINIGLTLTRYEIAIGSMFNWRSDLSLAIWEHDITMNIIESAMQGSVLLVWSVARLFANKSTAFMESCAATGWKDCDRVRSL